MWKIDFANNDDQLLIKNSGSAVIDELEKYFKEIIDAFDKLNRSVMCSSVIYPIESKTVEKQNLSIHYHIDSDEQIIRITRIEISNL